MLVPPSLPHTHPRPLTRRRYGAPLVWQGGGGVREEASEKRERQHLVQLVKIQAKEVEALKLEIRMLRRKGGHVYSAPVPAG